MDNENFSFSRIFVMHLKDPQPLFAITVRAALITGPGKISTFGAYGHNFFFRAMIVECYSLMVYYDGSFWGTTPIKRKRQESHRKSS